MCSVACFPTALPLITATLALEVFLVGGGGGNNQTCREEPRRFGGAAGTAFGHACPEAFPAAPLIRTYPGRMLRPTWATRTDYKSADTSNCPTGSVLVEPHTRGRNSFPWIDTWCEWWGRDAEMAFCSQSLRGANRMSISPPRPCCGDLSASPNGAKRSAHAPSVGLELDSVWAASLRAFAHSRHGIGLG
jgi:hypothetical protein